MPRTVAIKSEEEMFKLAQEVADGLKAGDILLLVGDLGTGKTTFTQGLARALGVAGDVSSPTFTLITEHEVPLGERFDKLIHIDLYRLDDEEVAQEGAIKEVLAQAEEVNGVVVIEWADKLRDLRPALARTLMFEYGSQPTERIVTLI